MIKLLFLLSFLPVVSFSQVDWGSAGDGLSGTPKDYDNLALDLLISDGLIKNGWYDASVHYSNYNTNFESTYKLRVKVRGDYVVAIDFGNGGELHEGNNDSGYSYDGDQLVYHYNRNNQIHSATTTVNITDKSGTRYFQIKIGQ